MAKMKYTFKVDFGDFTSKDIEDKSIQGICDAFIFHSILFAGGQREEFIGSSSGYGEELSIDEWFKSWTMMAYSLVEELPEGGRKELVRLVTETTRQVIMGLRDEVGSLPDTMEKIHCCFCDHVDYLPLHKCKDGKK